MMPPANVLYLSYDGLTDPLGQSQILPYLCGLSDEYGISIITFEKVERFIEEREKIEKICKENNIQWIPLRYHKKPPVISTMFDLWKLRRKASIVHKKYNFRIVHCRSYITSLIGLWMKKKYDIKFVFDMRGFWADERVEGGLWNLKNPLFKLIYNFFKRKEKDFLSKSDYIISLTENAKYEIASWNIQAAPIEVIPTCVDMELFNPELIHDDEKNALRKQLGLGADDFVLLYLGSWGTWYLTDEMLDFFTQLKKEKETSKLLIITTDKIDLKYYDHSADIIIRKVSRERVPLFISIANAAMVFIKPSFSKKASAATKSGEILAMGIPVLSNSGWGDTAIYEKNIPGFFIFPISDIESVRAMLTISIDPNEIRQKSSYYFSMLTGVKRYKEVYEKLR